MLYVRFPLSLRNVEDLLHERGVEVSHETVRFWWNRFGPMFASEITRKRRNQARSHSNWYCQIKRARGGQGCFVASLDDKTVSFSLP